MTFRDLGNCPEFEFTPNIERLDHFSSRVGVKTKDKSAVMSKSGSLRIQMEELTADNLALAVLGSVESMTDGDALVNIMDQEVLAARVRFTGTNDVGRKTIWNFDRVEFSPSSAINPISDEWMNFEITGETVAVAGIFGTIEFPGIGTAGLSSPDIDNYTIGKGTVEIELIV